MAGVDFREGLDEPPATRRPRTHVHRVRLDDQEMSKLQAHAKRRGVTASVILRELVRGARVATPGHSLGSICGAERAEAPAAL